MKRGPLGEQIASRLGEEADRLSAEFAEPGRIRTCILDDVIDAETARRVHEAFPPVDALMHRRSIREDKYVGVELDRYDPLVGEVLFAFQEPAVVAAVEAVTGLHGLLADPRLYAGGISAMTRGQYLNPHIDNSHREDLDSYRILNLLYYTTPDWRPDYGGHLQVWDRGLRQPARTLHSRCNRLVIMATSKRSWHAVDEVVHDGVRTCVSNYYFSHRPVTNEGEPIADDYFHVTTFRGFPGQRRRNAVLVADGLLRSGVRKAFKHGIRPTSQVYEGGQED